MALDIWFWLRRWDHFILQANFGARSLEIEAGLKIFYSVCISHAKRCLRDYLREAEMRNYTYFASHLFQKSDTAKGNLIKKLRRLSHLINLCNVP
jgi:hypothetical protein